MELPKLFGDVEKEVIVSIKTGHLYTLKERLISQKTQSLKPCLLLVGAIRVDKFDRWFLIQHPSLYDSIILL